MLHHPTVQMMWEWLDERY